MGAFLLSALALVFNRNRLFQLERTVAYERPTQRLEVPSNGPTIAPGIEGHSVLLYEDEADDNL